MLVPDLLTHKMPTNCILKVYTKGKMLRSVHTAKKTFEDFKNTSSIVLLISVKDEKNVNVESLSHGN